MASRAVANCKRFEPQFAGLVAGLPTLGLVTVVSQHSQQGPASVTPFLRGYAVSTMGKVLFGIVFASCATSPGTVPAMLCAILAGLTFCIVGNGVYERVPTSRHVAPHASRRAGGDRPHLPRDVRNGVRIRPPATFTASKPPIGWRSPVQGRHHAFLTSICLALLGVLAASAAPPASAQDLQAAGQPASVLLAARVVVSDLPGAHGIGQVGRFHVGGPLVDEPPAAALGCSPRASSRSCCQRPPLMA